MIIGKDSSVTIRFSVYDQDGSLIRAIEGDRSFTFVQGSRAVLPVIERALEGKRKGDRIRITVSPEDGYGLRDDSLRAVVSRKQFTQGAMIEPGGLFRIMTCKGEEILTVIEAGNDTVTLDYNHPLAGKTLKFDIMVSDVASPADSRDAR